MPFVVSFLMFSLSYIIVSLWYFFKALGKISCFFQEFKGLRYSVQQCAGVSSRSSAGSLDGSSVGGGYFTRYSFSDTPFDSTLDTTDHSSENILNDLTVSIFEKSFIYETKLDLLRKVTGPPFGLYLFH